MSFDGDDSRQLRASSGESSREIDAIDDSDLAGPVGFAAVTVNNGAYPASGAVGRVFAVQALEVTGAEAEGAVVATATRPGVFFAANLLGGLPPAGKKVIVYSVPYAWVFEYA